MKKINLIQKIRYCGYILICITLFYSCTCNDSKKEKLPTDADLTDMKVVVIDSCEYIQYHTYMYESITHKGNCKYCAERAKKLNK